MAAETTDEQITAAERWGAHNYAPLPVVLAEGEGSWVTDVEGRRYLDLLAAYSALNFGHRHPRLVDAARRQLDRLTLTSRAFHAEGLGEFCRDLAELCGLDSVLPMNTGAEGVETAIKIARRWGYEQKGIASDRAVIVACDGNFHGRTTTIVSFSTDGEARRGFGPFTPGFEVVPYGDADALDEALASPDVAGFLFEPVQGEAGVVTPPDGFLRRAREACDRHGVLLIADEIQSGLGRAGYTFACEHEGVQPDVYILGKALGGGIMPLSAVVATAEVMAPITPGSHGSTFGGNPLAVAVGREVLAMLRSGEPQARSAKLGPRFVEGLRALDAPDVVGVRGRGLWAGVDLAPGTPPGKERCRRLLSEGVLAKDTHERTLRFAPPLTIDEEDLDLALERIGRALA
ncbi:ornithine--oxo-acid transaminase [Egibacter rhizosphaerae]|uniref:ornithine aminotransferase n=1 Tax=Egibacter rhizosphaerae TaxID=1670831 RepID=A0A411YJT0_9ACTN|nr:ornithine--oxo-acid transaminase [Egibacter rhizosphaerae]QBI21456.1 ornithine--oxo-acid transaminase [Egibacter rhizosphaerae]